MSCSFCLDEEAELRHERHRLMRRLLVAPRGVTIGTSEAGAT